MRRVVKVGGSLLLQPDLKSLLLAWFRRNAADENLVVIGGGELVDAVRRLDQAYRGDPAEVHWQCVALLQLTFDFVRNAFDWPVVRDSRDLDRCLVRGFPTSAPTLVAVHSFYGRNSDATAPWDWQTTSDSIAAILAIRVQADELVLLKSCSVDPAADLEELASSGIIDAALPGCAAALKTVRVESLRSDH